DGIEILCVCLDGGCKSIMFGLSLDLNSPAVVVVLHGREAGNAHLLHSWQGMKALLDHAVQVAELMLRITGCLGIDVHGIAVDGVQLEVEMLEFVRALRK